MSRQQQQLDVDSGDTRRRLLEAGTGLFAEHGFKGVSVRELCAAADANVAAIQYHFGGKQGLYRAIFESSFDEDEARFQMAMHDISTVVDNAQGDRAQLSVALAMYLNSFFARFPLNEHKRWFSVLVLRELSFPGEGFELILERRAKPSQQVLARIIAALDGTDAPNETAQLQAYVLNGTIMSMIISRNIVLRSMAWDSFTPEKLSQLFEITSRLLFRALSLTPPQSMQFSGESI